MDQALERLAIVARYETDQPIYRYYDPAEHWFRIISGAARASALSGAGHRQIVDFLLVARYARCSAERLADSDAGVARQIRVLAFAAIARLQRSTVLLGRSSEYLAMAVETVSRTLTRLRARGVIAFRELASRADQTHACY